MLFREKIPTWGERKEGEWCIPRPEDKGANSKENVNCFCSRGNKDPGGGAGGGGGGEQKRGTEWGGRGERRVAQGATFMGEKGARKGLQRHPRGWELDGTQG